MVKRSEKCHGHALSAYESRVQPAMMHRDARFRQELPRNEMLKVKGQTVKLGKFQSQKCVEKIANSDGLHPNGDGLQPTSDGPHTEGFLCRFQRIFYGYIVFIATRGSWPNKKLIDTRNPRANFKAQRLPKLRLGQRVWTAVR